MNEKESLTGLKNLLQIFKLCSETNAKLTDIHIMNPKAYKEAIETMLDLYNKEKEKYKRLQNTEAFSEYYISKDKIKNILDKFNKGNYHYIHDLMQEIQDLLEEK